MNKIDEAVNAGKELRAQEEINAQRARERQSQRERESQEREIAYYVKQLGNGDSLYEKVKIAVSKNESFFDIPGPRALTIAINQFKDFAATYHCYWAHINSDEIKECVEWSRVTWHH